MFGHRFFGRAIYTEFEFKDYFEYLSRMELEDQDDSVVVIHISCHGLDDRSGIFLGNHTMNWAELALVVFSFACALQIKNKYIFVLSACNANKLFDFTTHLSGYLKSAPNRTFPEYIFVSNKSEVEWGDSLISWALLYHFFHKQEQRKNKNNKIDVLSKSNIQKFFKSTTQVNLLKYKYYRLDKPVSKYVAYTPKVRSITS